jgi:hypothetical protein
VNGREEGKREEKEEPEDVEPVEGGAFSIEHFGLWGSEGQSSMELGEESARSRGQGG